MSSPSAYEFPPTSPEMRKRFDRYDKLPGCFVPMVLPEPRVVSRILEALRAHNCDSVVSVGSGGRLDLERAIATHTITRSDDTASSTLATINDERGTKPACSRANDVVSPPIITTAAAMRSSHTENATQPLPAMKDAATQPSPPPTSFTAPIDTSHTVDTKQQTPALSDLTPNRCLVGVMAEDDTVGVVNVTAVDVIARDVVVHEGVKYVEATNGHTIAVKVGSSSALLMCWGTTSLWRDYVASSRGRLVIVISAVDPRAQCHPDPRVHADIDFFRLHGFVVTSSEDYSGDAFDFNGCRITFLSRVDTPRPKHGTAFQNSVHFCGIAPCSVISRNDRTCDRTVQTDRCKPSH